MALLMTLVMVGLGYAAVMVEDSLHNRSPFLFKLVAAMGLAALLSLLGFAGLRAVYRRQLNGRREQCRRLAVALFESRLGQAMVTAPARD